MDPFKKICIVFICERFRFTEFRDIFLSSSGMITLICIIFFKSLVIVVHEKCLPGPKLDCEIWVPVHNQAVRCAYRSKTWLSNMHTSPILVGEIQSPANSPLNITEIQGNHISPTGFGPVCISDRRGLDQYALLTDKFWTGKHI